MIGVMKRAERLHAISQRLRNAGSGLVSAATLAEQFEVSRRTIERDLASLRAAGVPVYGQPGRRGGTGSLERSGPRTVLLDEAQIVGLLIALHSAAGAPYLGAASSAINELAASLDPARREAVSRLCDRLRLDASTTSVNPRIRSTLEDVVRDHLVVNLGYTDRNGVETRRSVDPVAFLGVAGGWSLVGWCHLRDAGRLFRLGRITSATATRRPAARHSVDEALGWVPYDVRALSP